jgi:hypothetical protein
VTPFTCQVTAVFDVPVMLAEKLCIAPARTFAELGETETFTSGGGGFPDVPGLPGPAPPVTPAQAASKSAAHKISDRRKLRMDTNPGVDYDRGTCAELLDGRTESEQANNKRSGRWPQRYGFSSGMLEAGCGGGNDFRYA